MWIAAAALGLAVVVGTIVALAVAARLLPPGPTREVVAFVPNCVVLLRAVRGNERLPRRARLALGAALGYLLSPVQLIPNFVPVIGQADDVVVVVLALRFACRHLPREDLERAWPGDTASLDRMLGRSAERSYDRAP